MVFWILTTLHSDELTYSSSGNLSLILTSVFNFSSCILGYIITFIPLCYQTIYSRNIWVYPWLFSFPETWVSGNCYYAFNFYTIHSFRFDIEVNLYVICLSVSVLIHITMSSGTMLSEITGFHDIFLSSDNFCYECIPCFLYIFVNWYF